MDGVFCDEAFRQSFQIYILKDLNLVAEGEQEVFEIRGVFVALVAGSRVNLSRVQRYFLRHSLVLLYRLVQIRGFQPEDAELFDEVIVLPGPLLNVLRFYSFCFACSWLEF